MDSYLCELILRQRYRDTDLLMQIIENIPILPSTVKITIKVSYLLFISTNIGALSGSLLSREGGIKTVILLIEAVVG